MPSLKQQVIHCPYCGEAIEVLLDPQESGQQYIEDCQACCRPIVFNITEDLDGDLSVFVHDENDAY